MADAIVLYGAVGAVVFTLLVGGVGGYWIRAGEDQWRRARDARLIEELRAKLAPTKPAVRKARRGRHAAPKETPNE